MTRESYHENEEGAIGADESSTPRHPSIVVVDPPATSAPLTWTAEDDDPFCRVIDALPNTAAQHCAAVIYDLLFDYATQRIITSKSRMSVALIAGVAGCSKGAMWRSLPILQQAGLLVWNKDSGNNVTLQLTPPELPWHALSALSGQAMRERPSIIPPLLREMERRGAIAITFSGTAQVITHLRRRDGSESRHA